VESIHNRITNALDGIQLPILPVRGMASKIGVDDRVVGLDLTDRLPVGGRVSHMREIQSELGQNGLLQTIDLFLVCAQIQR